MIGFRNLHILLTKHKSLQLFVCLLLLSDRQQIVRAVNSIDVMESLLLEVLSCETLTTSDLKYLRMERIVTT